MKKDIYFPGFELHRGTYPYLATQDAYGGKRDGKRFVFYVSEHPELAELFAAVAPAYEMLLEKLTKLAVDGKGE